MQTHTHTQTDRHKHTQSHTSLHILFQNISKINPETENRSIRINYIIYNPYRTGITIKISIIFNLYITGMPSKSS